MAAGGAGDDLVGQLSLGERCALVAGASTWRTAAVPRLGIPALKLSDGPNGVRGEHFGTAGTPAVLLPVGIVQGATWDPELIGRAGDLLGREARRRGAHVLLGPAVNLHRTPVGGRTFEYLAEDPELTAALAAAWVRGVQAHDVAVTVKHLVANDTEVDRHTVDVVVDERVLRELYLRPFEACVREAGAWGVMTAYNRLGGAHCAEHERLLHGILRGEWGFDGFVVSDWGGAHHTVAAARAGLSLEMPGPPRVYGPALEEAVRAGEVEEAAVDALVADVLRLAERTRARERPADRPEESVDDPAERALCREVAIAGTVLARNVDGALPLRVAEGLTVAVLGPNAADTRVQGGGSSALRPLHHRSILDALRERLPAVVHEAGVGIDRYTPLPAPGRLVGTDGRPGLEVALHEGEAAAGEPAWVTRSDDGLLRFFGSLPGATGAGPWVVTVRGAYVPDVEGEHEVGLIATGRPAVRVGGVELARAGEALPAGESFFGYGSAEQHATLAASAGEPVPIEAELLIRQPFCALRIGVRPPPDPHRLDRAVDAAARSDVAVVVVGTNDEWETEGADRATIDLPGEQDTLVRAVAAVNDRTVVVVNAGAPVAMPWVDDVAAVVIPFFGGMEAGDAVADVLLGDADPGGRLPVTFPRRLEDAPAWPHHAPVDGVQRYAEGFAVGYRGHDATGIAPLFPFGHGLSYGTAEWGPPTASATSLAPGDAVTVTVPVTAGDRAATVVVQGYVAPLDPPVAREPKALRAWRKVVVPAGTTVPVALTFGTDAFRRWDADEARWMVDPGRYDLLLAASATDVRARVGVELGAGVR